MVVQQVATPAPDVIFDLELVLVTTSSVQLAWTQPNLNGTTFTQYVVQRRDTPGGAFADIGTSATPSFTDTTATPSTVYSYRVRCEAAEGPGAHGNVVEAETYPNVPLLNENFAFFSVANITSVFIVAVDPGVTITQTAAGGGANTIGPLAQGATTSVAAAQFDSFVGDGAFCIVGLISNDWFTLNPNYTAGKRFAYGPIRNNPQTVNVYAVEDANVTVTFGGAVVGGPTFVTGGTGASFSFTGTNANVIVESDGFVLASQTSNNSIDQTVLMPGSIELVGFPSNSARVYPIEADTYWGAFRADGSPFGGGGHEDTTQEGTIDGTGAQYSGDAVLVRASKDIAAASFADSDGGKAAPFLPTNLMRTKFGVPFLVERVNFASTQPFTITTSNGNTYPSNGSTAVQFAHITAAADIAEGTTFTADVPVGAWTEPEPQDEDELILFGFD